MCHKLTRAEVERMFPRAMFPDELAWECTVESYVGRKSCVGCEHFMEIDFSIGKCLSYHGICRKLSVAIANKNHAICEV